MANREVWTQRVEELRASGLTAKEFSAEKGFKAGTLAWWSSRLRREAKPEKVQLARVVRREQSRELMAGDRQGSGNIIVEVGGARVVVPRGADPKTLEMVLQAVTSEAGR